jgi:hypothetical protein
MYDAAISKTTLLQKLPILALKNAGPTSMVKEVVSLQTLCKCQEFFLKK